MTRLRCLLVRATRVGSVLVVCALAVSVLGCSSGITVRRVPDPGLLDLWRTERRLSSGDLSAHTLQTLRRCELEALYRRRPAEAYARLQSAALHDPQPDVVFALAEISHQLGCQAEKWEVPDACVLYYLCAGYAYHFLFPDGDPAHAADARPNEFDPRFRLASDLYNTGLSRCLRFAQRTGRLDPCRHLRLPLPDDHYFALPVVHCGFSWRPEEFGPLLFCADFEVQGLANQHRRCGLGVPLIGTRPDEPSTKVRDCEPGSALAFAQSLTPPPSAAVRYPRHLSFPVTAFLRFEGSLADLGNERAARLEFVNPFAAQTVDVRGRAVPLETDLTTPLAYFLRHTDLNVMRDMGFLHPDKVRDRAGIYLYEPYQPGKIPVILVHGLWSSPVTWATLFNDLRADPELGERFQFWFYCYVTGDQCLKAAADLRQALDRLREDFDPQHRDPALEQMVLVGHSMGGLVAKLTTVDGGEDFWRVSSAEPFKNLKVQPEARAELQRIFFFEKQPCVKRVIFLGTLHHGAKLTESLPVWLATKFAEPPMKLRELALRVARDNPKTGPLLNEGLVPTSRLMAPGSPFLELLAVRPKPDRVAYHSVIGVAPLSDTWLERLLAGSSWTEQSDGVVSYHSAHLDGVDSEIVISADHGRVKHHPLTVQEIRRILLEHLGTISGGR